MFPRLLRKPISYFGLGVEGRETPVPGAERDLKIPERTISPEYEGPQLFPSLQPLDVVPRPPTRAPRPLPRTRPRLGML